MATALLAGAITLSDLAITVILAQLVPLRLAVPLAVVTAGWESGETDG